MLASLAMAASALFAAQEGQALIQNCVLEESGWVCRYKVPDGSKPTVSAPMVITPSMQGTPTVQTVPPRQTPSAQVQTPASDAAAAVEEAEAARQAKLIRRCAGAAWYALCTPNDRKEAAALQEAALTHDKLKLEVTGLAAEGKCAEAVRVALQAGDLKLARDIKAVCEPAK